MKKEYATPLMQVIVIENENIILTASGGKSLGIFYDDYDEENDGQY